jgi:outer membrane protein OmpA-like peptidoglycan-associated protein
MRNLSIAVSVLLAIVFSPASAAERVSREEGVGVGVGATVGAVAGGPVGLLLGAAVGAKLGDAFHTKDEELETMARSVAASDERASHLLDERDSLRRDVALLTTDLERVQAVTRPELLGLMQTGIEMDLLFRTDEHVLTDTTGDRLEMLADSLAAMPDIFIQLDGFADERGDATYNLKLSEKRVSYVRNLLEASGVDASRIKVAAHGELPASDSNIDSYALQRRVSLTLYIEDQNSFAATP